MTNGKTHEKIKSEDKAISTILKIANEEYAARVRAEEKGQELVTALGQLVEKILAINSMEELSEFKKHAIKLLKVINEK